MEETARATSELLWRATAAVALVDLPLVALVSRLPASLFGRLKWHLAVAAALVYALLWAAFGSVLYWDQVYSAVFPAWSRWLLPPWFALLYAGCALLFWALARRAPRWPAAWFCLLGGLVSLPGHSIGIARGLLRVPLLEQVSPASALTFGVFEFVLYWCAIVGLARAVWTVAPGRWEKATAELRARLAAAREPVRPPVVDFGRLAGLPAPVERYLRAVLTEGAPMVAAARIRHTGTFNASEKEEKWRPFTSDQLTVARRPGFDWDARIAMAPGLTVRVHDAYVAGEGLLRASAFGLVDVVHQRGGAELARGELMRFLAEAAWYPTVLLPGQGVTWEAVDERSARATLRDGSVAPTLLFAFDEQGLVATVRAEDRGRGVGKATVPTPWLGRFWNYAWRGGLLVPLEGEVAWLLPDGPRPYWRGHLVAVEHEPAR